MTEILPCPICHKKGGDHYFEAYSIDSSFDYIGCSDCEIMIYYTGLADEAIAIWNQLAGLTKVIEAAKEAKYALETSYQVCEYPANGQSKQDDAIRSIEYALKPYEKKEPNDE